MTNVAINGLGRGEPRTHLYRRGDGDSDGAAGEIDRQRVGRPA
jgi:hypothetical protein